MRDNRLGIYTNFVDWISGQGRFDTWITVTLKQRTHDKLSRKITEDDVRRTAWILRDRITRHRKLNWVTFIHGGDVCRYHLHIMMERQKNKTAEDIHNKIMELKRILIWIYDIVEVKNIENIDYVYDELKHRYEKFSSRRMAGYGLAKNGIDGFCAEASSFYKL
jgi:hypothetical protein